MHIEAVQITTGHLHILFTIPLRPAPAGGQEAINMVHLGQLTDPMWRENAKKERGS